MTQNTTYRKDDLRKNLLSSASAASSLLYIFALLLLSVFFSDEIAHSVRSGLTLCANVIIPSVFPFMIISDFLYSSFDFSRLNLVNRLFERTFKIRSVGIYAFLLGILCGFPLGVKCACDLYRTGAISRDEAERLICFSNNTGPAFLVSGIGLGLRKNAAEGILLYVIMITSAIIVGYLLSIGKKPQGETPSIATSRFSITLSIKTAGLNTLAVCSYLTFFACLCGLLRKLLGESLLYLLLLPFLEIGSSSSILSKTALLSTSESFALTAFAVGFSGFSVHLQALSFLADTDLRTARYFIMKLLQGLVSLALAASLHGIVLS